MRELYAILGVPPQASPRALRLAYRRQARLRHPDAAGSESAMAELNKAYDVLADPARRARYDAERAPRLHAAVRRVPRVPLRSPPLPAEAVRFLESELMPLDRLIGLALDGLIEALEAGRPGGRGAQPAIGQAALTLQATGPRLARTSWPPSLGAARDAYGRGLREVSDAIADMADALTADDAAALREARRLLASGREQLARAIAP